MRLSHGIGAWNGDNAAEFGWLHRPWFGRVLRQRKEDLGHLLGLLASGAIRPRVAERISLDGVAEAHHRLEAGGLKGKLVLCPELPYALRALGDACER
jgi:NADPH:quinone reductase-like Zn-dependent oxidoreductase